MTTTTSYTPTRLRLREQDLVGKVAVITGASRGIGRSVALNLASRGCGILGTCSRVESIHLIDSLDHSIVGIYKDTNSTSKPKIIGLAANILSPTCAQDIADALTKHFSGRVDIFINNAAIPFAGNLGELTINEIQESMIGNIQTPVLIVEELVKRKMFQPESRIVHMSSVRVRQPWSKQLMYGATKSAGESMCRTWAQAFGGREEKFSFMAGTTANAVSTGLTQTDSVMQCPPEDLEGFKQEFITPQSLPRFGQPEDVADVVGLLCSHDARWITGCVVSASGGGIKLQ
ncbi:NAD(P)-binding protein [Rhizodiscina lignyota]|uniref:NAD(P)-binding protein n=1 Tax=Rhizodiscina lignyota TaxID=1504668 RepID=A0A9P4IDH1_9PEZI|nr:NAD(P)-binding protein [Rhizodiscina lignyota]